MILLCLPKNLDGSTNSLGGVTSQRQTPVTSLEEKDYKNNKIISGGDMARSLRIDQCVLSCHKPR